MPRIRKLTEIDEIFNAAEEITGSIKGIPSDTVFKVEADYGDISLYAFLEGRKNYCSFEGMSKTREYPIYRLFIWMEEDGCSGVLIRIFEDYTAEIMNTRTEEWSNAAATTEILKHEIREDTTWEILELLARACNCCPYFLHYPHLIKLECDNEEIISLYERVKDCAILGLTKQQNEDKSAATVLAIMEESPLGTKVEYRGGKYIFSYRYAKGEEKEAWSTTKEDTAAEAIRWMLDHKAHGVRLSISKNAYLFYDFVKAKVCSKNEKLTKSEERKARALKKALGIDEKKDPARCTD